MSKLRESIKKMYLKEDTKMSHKTRYGNVIYYVSDFDTCKEVFELVKNTLETGGCEILDSSISPVTEDVFDSHGGISDSNGYISFNNPEGLECSVDIFGYYYNRSNIEQLSRYNSHIFTDDYWYAPGIAFDCPVSELGSDIEDTLNSVLSTYGYEIE